MKHVKSNAITVAKVGGSGGGMPAVCLQLASHVVLCRQLGGWILVSFWLGSLPLSCHTGRQAAGHGQRAAQPRQVGADRAGEGQGGGEGAVWSSGCFIIGCVFLCLVEGGRALQIALEKAKEEVKVRSVFGCDCMDCMVVNEKLVERGSVQSARTRPRRR